MTIEEHMALYEDMNRKDAMKQVAKDRGVSKRDIYQALLKSEVTNSLWGQYMSPEAIFFNYSISPSRWRAT